MTVKRHGLRLKIAKRFIDESSYPWINFWLRLAGNALARHKEEYIFDFITKLGTVVFDNDPNARLTAAPVQPIRGTTTGRNYKGELNGSMNQGFPSCARLRHLRNPPLRIPVLML